MKPITVSTRTQIRTTYTIGLERADLLELVRKYVSPDKRVPESAEIVLRDIAGYYGELRFELGDPPITISWTEEINE